MITRIHVTLAWCTFVSEEWDSPNADILTDHSTSDLKYIM